MRHLYLLRSLVWILMFSLLITGCWDRREIEERMSVTSLAIDPDKKGYEVTAIVPIPTKIIGGGGGGGGGGEGSAVEVFSSSGGNLGYVINMLNEKTTESIYLGNTQIVLIGEGQAKRGIGPFIDFLRRNPEVRRQLWPVVIKGKAKDAVKVQTNLEQVPTNYIKDLLETGVEGEEIPNFYLGKLFVELSSPARQAPIVNYIRAEKDKYEWLGVAIFKKDKMVGTLEDKAELSVLLHLREQKKGRIITTTCPDRKEEIVFMPHDVKRTITVTDQPQVRANIEIRGEIIEKGCALGFDQKKAFNAIEKQLEAAYEKKAKHLMDRAQKEWKLDIFHFGDWVRAFRPELWKRIDWHHTFPSIPIQVNYKVMVKQIGIESQ
ncbi:Ger(x)C family spore germination protein [Thermoflavimicrobium dichotomicum]|uniref:Germination protein, Ger(X)C family n=1 Tax=Thermoflavimicrobium dichotomicum TaxID=46223 RepID=A0A1I3SW96_9BACL|nr:Ger(x)C family spore germination protein [Thermoflavimicrobium dichotomicum]SFJ61831.1 germination protein, Ger(x)C family [Thermoflavimicrobium dichotomicum]